MSCGVYHTTTKITNTTVSRKLAVYTGTGAVLPKPVQVKLPIGRVLMVVFPFMWAGATLSRNGAAFLEENDIFVPEDDDD